MLELLPVFTRKPLWGYRLAVAGMLGVTLLSFFVWQHHLFVSGINADLRPFYMLSTEIISLPTGFIFLCAMGTLWRGRIRLTVPMWFCIGVGVQLPDRRHLRRLPVRRAQRRDDPRQLLRDGPLPLHDHGRPGVHAVRRDLLLGPKMTGFVFNERLAKIHFWSLFIAFNATFGPLFALGMLGMPRRVVTYPVNLQALNDWVSAGAYVIGLSMLVFLVNLIWSMLIKREPLVAIPGAPSRRSGNCPRRCRSTTSIGSPCSTTIRTPMAWSRPRARRWRRPEGARRWKHQEPSAPTHPDIELEPPEWQPRAIWVGARQLCGAAAFFFLSFVFAYFYLRSLDLNKDWKIGYNINPSLGLGVAIVVALALSAALLRVASVRPELTVRAGVVVAVAPAGSRRAAGGGMDRSSGSAPPAAATPASTWAGPSSTPCSR